MEEANPYQQAKVFLAAITLIEYRDQKQADVGAIARLTTFSVERVHHLTNKLEKLGAVRRITGAFEDRVSVVDETAIESLQGESYSASIDSEVAQFADKQRAKQTEIENLFGGGDVRKQDLRSTLEDQLKSGGKTKKANPLDELSQPKDENKEPDAQ